MRVTLHSAHLVRTAVVLSTAYKLTDNTYDVLGFSDAFTAWYTR